MRRAQKLKALILGICYVSSGVFLNTGLALADARPYFKVFDGDVFAGGWFNAGQVACNPGSPNYQAPSLSAGTDYYKGGVMAYANQSGSGAGTQYGAFSLGLIEGKGGSGEAYGFLSAGVTTNRLSFANYSLLSGKLASGKYWGGFFEGTTRQSHCVPDYFSTKQNSPTAINSVTDISGMSDGQYLVDHIELVPVQSNNPIPANKHITIFVDGSVYIASNITYAERSTYTADTVPKFALVVRGNIYVAPTVGRLDGLYIAQPSADGTRGEAWTCHAGNTAAPTDTYISSTCRTKLTINGALVARKVNLLRVNGDAATATVGEDAGSGNIAEVFNFTPEMLIGGPFFNQSSNNGFKIQSITNLPPIF